MLTVGQNIVNTYGALFTEQGKEVIKALNNTIWMDKDEIYDHAKTYLKYCKYNNKDLVDMIIIILECITDVDITMSTRGYFLFNDIGTIDYGSMPKMREKAHELSLALDFYHYKIAYVDLKVWEDFASLIESALFNGRCNYLTSLWMAYNYVQHTRINKLIDKNTSIYKED